MAPRGPESGRLTVNVGTDRRAPPEDRETTRTIVVLMVVVGMLVGTALVASEFIPPPTVPSGPHYLPPVNATINTFALSGATPIPSSFWGINVGAGNPFTLAEARLLATTPVTYIRYPGGDPADEMNYTTGIITNKTGVTYPAGTPPAQFVDSCEAIQCHAILGLPAEIDSPSTAAYYVSYVEQTLHFTPAYWEIGNEPSAWNHYDQPWSEWATAPPNPVNISEYTSLLFNYSEAVRSVDPTTPLIAPALGESGIGKNCATWCGPVVSADGSLLGAVSVHSYPAFPPTASRSLTSFFSLLRTSAYALPTVVPADRGYIQRNYSGYLPLFVDEISTVPTTQNGEGAFANYTGELYGGLFDAAEVTQLLALDVANADWFDWASVDSYSWDGSGNGPLTPTGMIFQTFMPLLYSEYDPTIVVTPSTLYASATTDGTHLSLLVVNVNTTTPAVFPLSGLFSGAVEETTWANGTGIASAPVLNTTAEALPLSVSVWRGEAGAQLTSAALHSTARSRSLPAQTSTTRLGSPALPGSTVIGHSTSLVAQGPMARTRRGVRCFHPQVRRRPV